MEATRAWAEQQVLERPESVMGIGVFGSYGRGDAGVGSDLDLVVVLRVCDQPVWERLRSWDTATLPLSADLLIYSLEEWQGLPDWNPAFAEALRRDLVWLVGPDPLLGLGWSDDRGDVRVNR